MHINTSTSVCAFAQLVGSIAAGPTRAQFEITLLPGAASPDQVSPHNCSSTEASVCPQLLQMLYSSLDCPHLYTRLKLSRQLSAATGHAAKATASLSIDF